MSSAPDEGATVAPGFQGQPEALGGPQNVAPAAAMPVAGVADADDDAAAAGQQQQQQQEEEQDDDVLMLPAFQTGDMVVCPNPRRAGMLWPVSSGALVLDEKKGISPTRIVESLSRRPPF